MLLRSYLMAKVIFFFVRQTVEMNGPKEKINFFSLYFELAYLRSVLYAKRFLERENNFFIPFNKFIICG